MRNKGFSLVELSIVLVILGLLIGGVLGGQALIRASELRSITVDKDKLLSAIMTFRNKYNGLPGDITNATSFWGATHATPATCLSTVSSGTSTCNGDGNMFVGGSPGTPNDIFKTNEAFLTMKHLSNAGLIEGGYTGVSANLSSTGRVAEPGVNIPRMKMDGVGVSFLYMDREPNGAGYGYYGMFSWSSYGDTIATTYNHVLLFGKKANNELNLMPFLTPQEMWSIDAKIDDGFPGRGSVMSFADGCATTQLVSTAAYNMTSNNQDCRMLIKSGF